MKTAILFHFAKRRIMKLIWRYEVLMQLFWGDMGNSPCALYPFAFDSFWKSYRSATVFFQKLKWIKKKSTLPQNKVRRSKFQTWSHHLIEFISPNWCNPKCSSSAVSQVLEFARRDVWNLHPFHHRFDGHRRWDIPARPGTTKWRRSYKGYDGCEPIQCTSTARE